MMIHLYMYNGLHTNICFPLPHSHPNPLILQESKNKNSNSLLEIRDPIGINPVNERVVVFLTFAQETSTRPPAELNITTAPQWNVKQARCPTRYRSPILAVLAEVMQILAALDFRYMIQSTRLQNLRACRFEEWR